jgi:hypothetical protein
VRSLIQVKALGPRGLPDTHLEHFVTDKSIEPTQVPEPPTERNRTLAITHGVFAGVVTVYVTTQSALVTLIAAATGTCVAGIAAFCERRGH